MAVQFHIMQSSGKLGGATIDRLERLLNETYDAWVQLIHFADNLAALYVLFVARVKSNA